MTVPSQEQSDAATVVSEGAVSFVPSGAQVEMTAATTSPVGLGVTLVVSEG